MAHFYPAEDGSSVNLEHVVAIEILDGPKGFVIRARTIISWPTAGYGHAQGHLYTLKSGLATLADARKWVSQVTEWVSVNA